MIVKAKTKLFPSTGTITINSYIKYNRFFYKVIKKNKEYLKVIDVQGNTKEIPLNECILHKMYAVSRNIIAEILYENVSFLDIGRYYNFNILSVHTKVKVGDIVNIFKFKISNILSLTNTINGIVKELNGSDFEIELADGDTISLKRHMFKKSCDIKYYAKWIS
jgi:hypothetical protein